MIAALFAERNSPEKSSALSAVKPQRGCILYYTGKLSSKPPVAF